MLDEQLRRKSSLSGLEDAVDCDVHPAVPDVAALRPYMSEFWGDNLLARKMTDAEPWNYPLNAPLACRPDWRPDAGKPGQHLGDIQRHVFGDLAAKTAILNPLYGVNHIFSEDIAAVLASAVNDWIAAEWLGRDERLRGSMLVPLHNPALAVAEIERLASDRRFVQVLVPVSNEMLLGRRVFWPIYEACERHGLVLGIHAGTTNRHPHSSSGPTSYFAQDYLTQAQAFQSTLTSLIVEGVFTKYPALKVVLIESGVSWLPAMLMRLSKFWRGLRVEIPWVHRSPYEVARDNVRLTTQPFDAPETAQSVQKLVEMMGSDEMLLFSSDYPHWQFDGNDPVPGGFDAELIRKIAAVNPRATYSRL